MSTTSTPDQKNATVPARYPVVPSGRTLVFMHTLSELVSKVKTGELLEGAVIGVCGPNCGDLILNVLVLALTTPTGCMVHVRR